MPFEVLYIDQPGDSPAANKNRAIGGINNGEPWKITYQQAISGISSGRSNFYITKDGHRTNLIVGVAPDGNPCLRAENADDASDPLLSLPGCP